MNATSLNTRFSAAATAVVVTFALLAGLANMAKPQAASTLMAQAGTAIVVR